jgi:hypothetical protein
MKIGEILGALREILGATEKVSELMEPLSAQDVVKNQIEEQLIKIAQLCASISEQVVRGER